LCSVGGRDNHCATPPGLCFNFGYENCFLVYIHGAKFSDAATAEHDQPEPGPAQQADEGHAGRRRNFRLEAVGEVKRGDQPADPRRRTNELRREQKRSGADIGLRRRGPNEGAKNVRFFISVSANRRRRNKLSSENSKTILCLGSKRSIEKLAAGGANVMIIIFGDFRLFSTEKIGIFLSKTML
jgi:hypothetical protein